MKLDLNLLSIRFSQAKDEQAVSTDGVKKYLLEEILLPCMNDKAVYLRDVDFEAFDAEDVNELEEYYGELYKAGRKLRQLTETVGKLSPEAQKARMFC